MPRRNRKRPEPFLTAAGNMGDVKGGESYSAILATGGIFGALLSGLFARFLGRKKSLVLAGFIYNLVVPFTGGFEVTLAEDVLGDRDDAPARVRTPRPSARERLGGKMTSLKRLR